jgi:hypothetical protein
MYKKRGTMSEDQKPEGKQRDWLEKLRDIAIIAFLAFAAWQMFDDGIKTDADVWVNGNIDVDADVSNAPRGFDVNVSNGRGYMSDFKVDVSGSVETY